MQIIDQPSFAALMAQTWRVYGKVPQGEDIALYFELLADFPFDGIAIAIKKHLRDPQAGQYLPKPSDIIRHLQAAQAANDGRPEPDEAWGMLNRLISDERETGVMTEEMRAGWHACGPILDLGDEVGARRCFLVVYQREVQEAREARHPVKWSLSLGTDQDLRRKRVAEAHAQGRISPDQAQMLLPEPPTFNQALARLEDQRADRQEVSPGLPSMRERLQALAAQLRREAAGFVDDESAVRAEQARLEALENAPRPARKRAA